MVNKVQLPVGADVCGKAYNIRFVRFNPVFIRSVSDSLRRPGSVYVFIIRAKYSPPRFALLKAFLRRLGMLLLHGNHVPLAFYLPLVSLSRILI